MDEIERILAKGSLHDHYVAYQTLLGLRNIAWAMARQDHENELAHQVQIMTSQLVENPYNVGFVIGFMEHSPMNI